MQAELIAKPTVPLDPQSSNFSLSEVVGRLWKKTKIVLLRQWSPKRSTLFCFSTGLVNTPKRVLEVYDGEVTGLLLLSFSHL